MTATANTKPTAAKDTTSRIAGGKVGVLLLHGLCGTPAEMRFVAMGLARAGYTVHCPQLAGHGGTEESSGRLAGLVPERRSRARSRCARSATR